MQIQNLEIYSSAIADASSNGPWIDVSNLVGMSVQVNAYQGTTDVEVSNDPSVMFNGAAIGPPSVAPVLSQFPSITQGFNSLVGGNVSTVGGPPDISQLPEPITFFVKTTFITKWGETTASAESSLAVTFKLVNGVAIPNYLYVAPPVPTTAQAAFVTGWNCYVSLATGTEVLQTAPPYTPQRLADGYGTVGGTVSPLAGQSTHFTITGALPLQQAFSMVNGFKVTQWTPPGTDMSGGTNSGVSASNGHGLASLITTPNDNTSVAVFGNGGNVMWSPSSMTWKFLRVTNGAASTIAYLNGQRG